MTAAPIRRRTKRFVLGENEQKILLAIGAGLLASTVLIFPGLPIALKPIFKMRGERGFQKALKKLEDKNIIVLGGEKITLTKKGKALQKQLTLKQFLLNRENKWDGKWRLVSYDIPEKNKKRRDGFRQALKRIGFGEIQESLWLFPYECREEIAVIARDFRIEEFVIVMETDRLPREEYWQEQFDLIEEI